MEQKPTQSLTDEQLVLNSLKNAESFGCLIERYEAKLTRYIKRRAAAGNEDVQDLLQDIFIKCYANLHGFDSRLSFSSWIYRIAHNTIISWYRKNKARPQYVPLSDDHDSLLVFADDTDLESQHQLGQDKDAVVQAISLLNEKYKEVLLLKYFEDKSYDEISDILAIPPGTVATRINRAKANLKKLLNQSM